MPISPHPRGCLLVYRAGCGVGCEGSQYECSNNSERRQFIGHHRYRCQHSPPHFGVAHGLYRSNDVASTGRITMVATLGQSPSNWSANVDLTQFERFDIPCVAKQNSSRPCLSSCSSAVTGLMPKVVQPWMSVTPQRASTLPPLPVRRSPTPPRQWMPQPPPRNRGATLLLVFVAKFCARPLTC